MQPLSSVFPYKCPGNFLVCNLIIWGFAFLRISDASYNISVASNKRPHFKKSTILGVDSTQYMN
jgi:hypothetical protein